VVSNEITRFISGAGSTRSPVGVLRRISQNFPGSRLRRMNTVASPRIPMHCSSPSTISPSIFDLSVDFTSDVAPSYHEGALNNRFVSAHERNIGGSEPTRAPAHRHEGARRGLREHVLLFRRKLDHGFRVNRPPLTCERSSQHPKLRKAPAIDLHNFRLR
jgi:hypothetical protein